MYACSEGTCLAILFLGETLPHKSSSFSTRGNDLIRLTELPWTISESHERRFLGTHSVIFEREGSDARSMTSRRERGAEIEVLADEEGLFPNPGVEKTAGPGAGVAVVRTAQT